VKVENKDATTELTEYMRDVNSNISEMIQVLSGLANSLKLISESVDRIDLTLAEILDLQKW